MSRICSERAQHQSSTAGSLFGIIHRGERRHQRAPDLPTRPDPGRFGLSGEYTKGGSQPPHKFS